MTADEWIRIIVAIVGSGLGVELVRGLVKGRKDARKVTVETDVLEQKAGPEVTQIVVDGATASVAVMRSTMEALADENGRLRARVASQEATIDEQAEKIVILETEVRQALVDLSKARAALDSADRRIEKLRAQHPSIFEETPS